MIEVFYANLDRLLHDLRNGKKFGQRHKPAYGLRVIEYLPRGLQSSAHIVVQLHHIPHWKTEVEELSLWIYENISATYP